MFRISVEDMSDFHLGRQADCTPALKPMKDFDRVVVVETDHEGHIRSFREKQYYASGLINGGVYAR